MVNTTKPSLGIIGLFRTLPEEDLAAVAQRCIFRNYRAGELIIDRHSESKDVFFVLSGKVRVVNYSLSGREITLVDLIEGAYFGELAAIDGHPRSASVEAIDDVVVASLSSDAFIDLIRTHSNVAMVTILNLVRIVRTATARIMDLSTLGANYRVMAELLREALSHSDDGMTSRISPIPIHSDVASKVSTTRETVARVISDLTRKGLVKKDKSGLDFTNLEKLEEIVEEVRGE